MAIPEQIGQMEAPIEEVPESAEIPAEIGELTGAQAVPATPAPLKGDDNQTIAQPVPSPAQAKPGVKIPAASEEELKQMKKGSAGDSSTWFGVLWLKKIKIAIKEGLTLVFGNK